MSYNTSTQELAAHLKTLILAHQDLASPDLIALANSNCNYLELLSACFKNAVPGSSLFSQTSNTSFFNSLPSNTSLELAHFGYLVYLKQLYTGKSLDTLPDSLSEEELGNWCNAYYESIKDKLTSSQKLYLAKLLPQTNPRTQLALNYLSTLKSTEPVQKITYPFEMLSLCFNLENQTFLHHLFVLSDLIPDEKEKFSFFNAMIYLYTHSEKSEFKQACKTFIEEIYNSKRNAFDKEKLSAAWCQITASHKQGQSKTRDDVIDTIIAYSLINISMLSVGLICCSLPLLILFCPLPTTLLLISALLLTFLLTYPTGAWILQDVQRSESTFASNHSHMETVAPRLKFFLPEECCPQENIVNSTGYIFNYAK